jgi:4-hydroxy-tetrahydrodipicolinate synthase
MAGFSYPEMLAGVYRLFTQGRSEEGHDMFDCYLPLLSYEAQGFWGVAARKEVFRRRAAIKHATMRAPGPTLTKEDHAELDLLVRRVEKAIAESGYASKAA